MSRNVSVSPEGMQYPIPEQEDYEGEFLRIKGLVENAKVAGQEIVVVMGVGFVGAVMAAIVADTNEVQAELADGGRTDLLIDAILADTNELQTDDTPTAIAAVKTVVDLVEDILRNKMEITDANGNLVLYEDDGTTPKYSVNACVTDDATTTIRKRLE